LQDIRKHEQVLEPGRVAPFQVAAPRSVEPLDCARLVAAVDASPCVGKLAIGIGCHGWGKTVSLSSQSGHTRVRISPLASPAWTRLERFSGG